MASLELSAVWLRPAEVIALGVPHRTIYDQLAKGKLTSRELDGAREVQLISLPSDAQLAWLAARGEAADEKVKRVVEERQRRVARFSARPDVLTAIVGEAGRRAALLDRFAAISPKNVGGKVAPAVEALLDQWIAVDPLVLSVEPSWGRRPSVRTLWSALACYRDLGNAVALIPAPPRIVRPDDKRRETKITPEIEAHLFGLRLHEHPNATFVSLCRKLEKIYGAACPSRTTLRRALAKLPKSAQVYFREGKYTFRGTTETPIHRDLSDLDVGEWLCGDHHQLDLEIIDNDHEWSLARPWLTMWVDLRTRAPVGWVIRLEPPNGEAIAQAFVSAVGPKASPLFAKLWGIPKVAYVDNGKDYRSKRLEAVFATCGVEVRHAQPYNAKAKPVERFFGTVCSQFARDFETWCGNRTDARTERYSDLRALHEKWRKDEITSTPFMTLDELKRRFEAWVLEHLETQHEGLREAETGRPRTPVQVAATRREEPLAPAMTTLALLAWPTHDRTVRKGEVQIGRFYYTNPELKNAEGEEVRCLLNPADAKQIYVIALRHHGRYRKDEVICEARSAELARMARRGDGEEGSVTAKHLAEMKRLQKNEERTMREAYRIKARRLSGRPILEIPAGPPVEPATPTPAPPPLGSVTQLFPTFDRYQRQLAKLGAAPREPAPAVDAAPPAAPLSLEEEALARSIEILGPRPEIPDCLDPDTKAQAAEERAAWDELHGLRLARLTRERHPNAAGGTTT